MNRIPVIVLLLFSWLSTFSQVDSDTLFYSDFLGLVVDNHPLSQQAKLRTEMGEAYLLKARGSFDPKLQGTFSNKDFQDKDYYKLIGGALKLPTRLGVDLVTGYEQNSGLFLDPENTTPNNGLMYAGISVPVGQGLITDARRTELRKAEIYRDMNELQRRLMLNELLYDASLAYFDWMAAYYKSRIYREGLDLAEFRLEAVRRSAGVGELPAIDTLEATIQVKNRRVKWLESINELRNKQAELETFLWLEGKVPVMLDDSAAPGGRSSFSEIGFFEYMGVMDEHPMLMETRYKTSQLLLDNRWLKEQLKPELDIQYKALAPLGPPNGFNQQDYTLGLNFSMPILLRKERGELRLNNLKIESLELELLSKQANLNAKWRKLRNDWELNNSGMEVMFEMVRGYERLADAERRLFQIGESSLFLVNQREMNYIQSSISYLDYEVKRSKIAVGSQYLGLGYGPLNISSSADSQ